jgi:hypothetical protein
MVIPFQFQCCGLDSSRDWLLSSFACLPLSCCNTDTKSRDACRSLLIDEGSNSYRNLENYSFETFDEDTEGNSMLWTSGCQEKVVSLINGMTWKWLICCGIFLTSHIILSIWMTHITQLVYHLFDSREGYAQLRVIRIYSISYNNLTDHNLLWSVQ